MCARIQKRHRPLLADASLYSYIYPLHIYVKLMIFTNNTFPNVSFIPHLYCILFPISNQEVFHKTFINYFKSFNVPIPPYAAMSHR